MTGKNSQKCVEPVKLPKRYIFAAFDFNALGLTFWLFLFSITDASLFGGNVTVRGTAEMAQTNPPPAQCDTAGLASFSATMETAPVRTSCVTATKIVPMAPMKTSCSVVRFFS